VAKAVEKALNILSYLGQGPGREIPLSEISEHIGSHPATVAGVLKLAIGCGYVEQRRVRGGYTLGPMAYRLSQGNAYRMDLVAPAEPEMVRLARRVGESVLLTTLTRGRKSILCVVNGSQDVQIRQDLVGQEDLYTTATGRVLLAYQSRHEIGLCVALYGYPGREWGEIHNEEELIEALGRIRERGHEVKTNNPSFAAYAVPIFEHGEFVAAMGLMVPAFRRTKGSDAKILNEMKETSAAISLALENRKA